MLYVTIRDNRVVSYQEQKMGPDGFTMGAVTTPYRCDDPSEQFHRERSGLVRRFVEESLAKTTIQIPDQSSGFWLGDMRDAACKFFAWGAQSSTDFLIPDPHYLQHRGYSDLFHQLHPWQNRKDLVFWRGGLTRPMAFWSKDPDTYPRFKLVAHLAAHPSCDVKLSYADYSLLTGPSFHDTILADYRRLNPGPFRALLRRVKASLLYRVGYQELIPALEDRSIRVKQELMQRRFESMIVQKGLVGAPLPMQTWSTYKYTIDIDGFGPSWKFFPCLAQGMVVFKVDSDFNLFFTKDLDPFVHYIPVAKDLSDLSEMLDWAFSNPGHCQAISDNAREICRSQLSYESASDALVRDLLGIA